MDRPAVTAALDLSSYELDGLRDDVKRIVSPSGAVSGIARWTLALPAMVCAVVWLIFNLRIDSGFWLGLFAVIAALLAVPAGALVGGWRLAGTRLDAVTEATGRVVTVVGAMHNDVVSLQQGHAETSVQKVAVGLVEEAILPAVFGSVTAVATGALGPAGFIAEKAAQGPMKLVERSVIAAIEALPDRRIGQLAEGAAESVDLDRRLGQVRSEYESVRDRLTGVVERVGRTSLRVGASVAVVSLVPLAVWLALGWVAS